MSYNFIQRFITRQIDYKNIEDTGTSESYTISIEEGLSARIKDPLWFLSRQWQMAEFEASNGGSPIWMNFETEDSILDEIIYKDNTNERFDISIPLESIIEGGSGNSSFADTTKTEEQIIADAIALQPKAWDSERLEYTFKISESAEKDVNKKIILNAQEYYGERLDWYSFTLSQANTPVQTTAYESTPKEVEFSGMPKTRFWEFEDYNIDFGNLVRPQINPISMLLTEFVVLFSNDYFVFPIPQKVGTLRTIKNVEVTDVFGNKITIQPHIVSSDDQFTLFTHNEDNSTDSSATSSANFYFPNIVTHSYKSDPLEEVIFYRDEVQDMAWAVERKYWNNKIINRADELNKSESDAQQAVKASTSDTQTANDSVSSLPKYIIKTPIPDNWIPYIPIKIDDTHFKLRRARTSDQYNKTNTQYKTKILAESKYIFEEEIQAVPILLRQFIEMTFVTTENEKKYIFWLGREKSKGETKEHINIINDQLSL